MGNPDTPRGNTLGHGLSQSPRKAVKVAAAILAIAVGSMIGFFGVFVSVFADGSRDETLQGIGVILVIYAALGGLWGCLVPQGRWVWAALLGAPGAAVLLWYMTKEPSYSGYFMLYVVLLLAAASVGALGGSALRGGRQPRS